MNEIQEHESKDPLTNETPEIPLSYLEIIIISPEDSSINVMQPDRYTPICTRLKVRKVMRNE